MINIIGKRVNIGTEITPIILFDIILELGTECIFEIKFLNRFNHVFHASIYLNGLYLIGFDER